MRTIDHDAARRLVEIQQFVYDFWHDVDTNGAANAPSYFSKDCRLAVSAQLEYSGQDGVKRFYSERATRGTRTTHHLISNLRIVPERENLATVNFIIVNFAADGRPPIQGLTGPAVISRVEAVCLLGDSGWQFESLSATPLFIGSEPYTRSVLADGKSLVEAKSDLD
ncbi:nuclear transport factor 2 family protein [Microbulbifer pacificus]|uniref:Nuclear transport factor 2 family protein n=1 Tax=Microbulbifer pacificus TaxID=407164 RepID=A0AAU0N217_9GAMM|nr:nuclear transport factor 2 family protein [Microbulbifer pacificus]WOX07027.1 nuclear transport factor 2 family protein [Microbulbifer pacificus]